MIRLHLRRLVGALIALPSAVHAQQLTPAETARIDSVATAVLTSTGAPSASIAIVRGGAIVYEHAYGNARIDPVAAATPAMRYSIGSVSKQFTATAILLLAEDGRLSLDDKVAKWFPSLTRAGDISLRHLLSMTSGYQDYWPQDYVFTDMQRAAATDEILRRWAQKPLDFEPGSKWQYSNTNYVIAGLVVEKVSGMPFMDFLHRHIFARVGMTSVADFDAAPLGTSDAGPFLRNAVGPLRPAPKEGRGWLFGAGQLAMTAHDLALWNISMINGTVLKSASYRTMQTDMLLTSGLPTGYGLGVNARSVNGRRRISHGGAVSGYTTTNDVYPEDKVAITVFTNIYPGAAGASAQIAGRIAGILFPPVAVAASATEQAKRIYDGLRQGTIDRTQFTPDANAYFTQQVVADYAASLGPLGAPTEFAAGGESLRGGMTIRSYRIRAGGMVLDLTTMTLPDGKIDQFIVSRAG
jgi:D-alanyl-D-alanine carboxypeptidase